MAEDAVEVPTRDDVEQMMEDLGDEVQVPEGFEAGKATPDPEPKPEDDKAGAVPVHSQSDESGGEDDSTGDSEVSKLTESDEIIKELTGSDEAEEEDDSSEEDDEAILKGASDETVKAFKDMRLKIKTLNERLESNDDSDRVKALQSQLTQAQMKLGAIDLAQSPQFRQKYDAPIAKELTTLKKIVADAGGQPQTLVTALRFNNMVERKKFLAEELPLVANELSIMMTRLDSLRSERASELRNFAGAKKNMVMEESAKQAQLLTTAFDDAVSAVSESGHFVYRTAKAPGSEEWNKGVVARTEEAKKLAESAAGDVNQIASMALKSVAADDLLKRFIQERKTRISLEKKLGIKSGSTPKVGAGSKKAAAKTAKDRGAMDGEDIANLIAGRDYGAGSLS